MAITGPDGMNAPETRPDGVNSADWQELNARAFTLYRREPFMPDFGIGLAGALGNPALSPAEIQRRFVASLENSYLGLTGVEIAVDGTVYRIDASMDVDADSP